MNATSTPRVAAAIARTPVAPELSPTERPPYVADPGRYDVIGYRHTGRSGLQLPRDQPRPVAQLRRRRALRPPARPRAPRLRPGRHAVRPGQQLRPALRLGRGELRAHLRQGPAALPRRAGHHHEGRLGHVVRPVRLPGLAQVPAGLARPVASRAWASTTWTSSTRTASTRTRRSRRRWARSTPRSSRARPATSASAPTRPSAPGRPSPSWPTWARRCSSTSPTTRCSTAGSRTACSTCSARPASAASPSRPSPRACSRTATWRASRPAAAPARTSRCHRPCSARRTWRASGR